MNQQPEDHKSHFKFVLIILALVILILGVVFAFWYAAESISDPMPQEYVQSQTTATITPRYCTSSTGKVMTYEQARTIAAASSCATEGSFTEQYHCNDNGGGLVDVFMEPYDAPTCGLVCLVSIDGEQAEAGWRCMGAVPSTAEELEGVRYVEDMMDELDRFE